MKRKEIQKFVKSQRSIRLYKKVQQALTDVLLVMPNKDYKVATKNLILMVLHETALGQLMHISGIKGKFKILQMSIAKKASLEVLHYVIAHELGHALQGRNWKRGDGTKLEEDADNYARGLGFPRPRKIPKLV